jgi:hypothetical protein
MKQKLNRKWVYITLLVIFWLLPLLWIIPTGLATINGPCQENMPAWLSCFSVGYLGPPFACGFIAAGVLYVTYLLVKKIIKTKW